MDIGDAPSPRLPSARVRFAEVLAFVALVAALIGALGPAERIRATYSWPPSTVSEGMRPQFRYAPLLLARRVPESIAVTLSCSQPTNVGSSESTKTTLATTRHLGIGGLDVTRGGARLVVGIGDKTIARLPVLQRPTDDSCTYRLHVADLQWSILGGPENLDLAGDLESMPIVNGLFSDADLRGKAAPTIRVTTQTYATRTTPRQTIAWILGALAVAAALALVTISRRPRRRPHAVGRFASALRTHVRPADGLVGVVLVGWWLVAPAHWDDGWVMARQRAFSTSRGFSNYYDSFGVNFPNGYWLEWVQHWLVQASNHLVVLRLPALLFLAAIWVLCRWIIARVAAGLRPNSGLVLWILASGFLVGAMAWGMTLRPEPVSALIVTSALACTVRFVERGGAAPLAVLAVLVPLAMTAHHSGLLALAPVLLAGTHVYAWARRDVAVAAVIGTTMIALLIALAFVGSDIAQRSADAHVFGTYGVADAWYDEFRRYAYLSDENGGTPLKRGSFALIALAVLAYVFRRTRERRPLLDLPAATLTLSLAMLVVVPSKWPWHFGTLLGIAAVATATEAARLRGEATRSAGWALRPFVNVLAVMLAIAWAWGKRERWTILDVRTLDWRLGFEQQLPLTLVAVSLPVLTLALLLVLLRDEDRRRQAPWLVAATTAAILAAPLIAFTAAVLVSDSVKTGAWTLARQNVETIRGDPGCALADEISVPVRSSMEPLAVIGGTKIDAEAPWLPPAPIAGLPSFALGPTGQGAITATPWFELSAPVDIGFFVAGPWSVSDRVTVEWGRQRAAGSVESLGARAVRRDLRSGMPGVSPWRFVGLAELKVAPEPRANAVRVILRSQTSPGAALGVTAPVTYASEKLGPRLGQPGVRALVGPGLRAYFPCITQPAIRNGVVEAPKYIVAPGSSVAPLTYPTSPFLGLLDIFAVHRQWSVLARPHEEGVAIYEVDTTIPGARLIPAETAIASS